MGSQIIRPVPSALPRFPVFYDSYTEHNFNTDPVTISGLLGDAYDYTVLWWSANASGDSILDITANSDVTDYRNYELKGLGSSATAAVGDSDTAIELQDLIGSAQPGLMIMKITGDSSDERYFDILYTGDSAILKQSSYWIDTTNELNTLTFTGASSVTTDATISIFATPKGISSENWDLIETQSWVNQDINTTPIDFTGLDLDRDIEYLLVGHSQDSSSGRHQIIFNQDTGANYIEQEFRNQAGTDNAVLNTRNELRLNSNGNTDKILFSNRIVGDSSQKRLCLSNCSTQGATFNQNEIATWWDNTVDNLDEIRIFGNDATATYTGEASLYKKKNPNTVADRFNLPFKMIEEVAVSGDFSGGHTFTVEGNKVLMYKLEWLGENTANIDYQLAGDTGTNYDYQRLLGSGGSSSASTSAGGIAHRMCQNSASAVNYGMAYIFPQTGENRPSLNIEGYDEDSIRFQAHLWVDDATEIDEIKVFGGNTNTCTGTLRLSAIPLPKSAVNADTAFINDRNDKYTVSDAASLDITGDFTFTAFGKPDVGSIAQDSGIINKQASYNMWQHTSQLKLDLNATTLVGPTVTAGVWQWYMCRRSGSSVDMSINDGTKTNHVFGTALTTNNTTVLLGNYSVGTRGFEGSLGFFTIWDVGLTDAEVTTLYNGGVGLSWAEVQRLIDRGDLPDNCVMYIEAAEYPGLVGNPYDDQSGNGNDATEVSITYTDAGLKVF